jgi:hypothetical protein
MNISIKSLPITNAREEFLQELLEEIKQNIIKEFEKEDILAKEVETEIRKGVGRPRKHNYKTEEEKKKVYLEIAQKKYNRKPRPIPDNLIKIHKQKANAKYYLKKKAEKMSSKVDLKEEIKNEILNDNTQ